MFPPIVLYECVMSVHTPSLTLLEIQTAAFYITMKIHTFCSTYQLGAARQLCSLFFCTFSRTGIFDGFRIDISLSFSYSGWFSIEIPAPLF